MFTLCTRFGLQMFLLVFLFLLVPLLILSARGFSRDFRCQLGRSPTAAAAAVGVVSFATSLISESSISLSVNGCHVTFGHGVSSSVFGAGGVSLQASNLFYRVTAPTGTSGNIE